MAELPSKELSIRMSQLQSKKRLLLFIDSNIRTIPYEVPLNELLKESYEIYFLSILKPGPIHEDYRKLGFKTFSLNYDFVSTKNLPKYAVAFIKMCRLHKIDVVHAHLTIPSLVGVFAQYFIKAKVLCFRHHFNYINLVQKSYKVNKVEKAMDSLTAILANKIVVPNYSLKELIEKYENVNSAKLAVIPYVYDWRAFLDFPRLDKVKDGVLRLLMISRLSVLKRPQLAIQLVFELKKLHVNVKLTILGEGALKEELQKYCQQLDINEHISFEGFHQDIRPFLSESDLLIHPSITEASSSVVKEAGVMEKIIIACKDVGDFNEYIEPGINGWLVNAENFVDEAKAIIMKLSKESDVYCDMGKKIKKRVLDDYSITEKILALYKSLES